MDFKEYTQTKYKFILINQINNKNKFNKKNIDNVPLN